MITTVDHVGYQKNNFSSNLQIFIRYQLKWERPYWVSNDKFNKLVVVRSNIGQSVYYASDQYRGLLSFQNLE